MLNHLVTVVVWLAVGIAVFQLFDIDAAFFLSSAGFLGAAVAIGGQHKVNDYLTGLSVLVRGPLRGRRRARRAAQRRRADPRCRRPRGPRHDAPARRAQHAARAERAARARPQPEPGGRRGDGPAAPARRRAGCRCRAVSRRRVAQPGWHRAPHGCRVRRRPGRATDERWRHRRGGADVSTAGRAIAFGARGAGRAGAQISSDDDAGGRISRRAGPHPGCPRPADDAALLLRQPAPDAGVLVRR